RRARERQDDLRAGTGAAGALDAQVEGQRLGVLLQEARQIVHIAVVGDEQHRDLPALRTGDRAAQRLAATQAEGGDVEPRRLPAPRPRLAQEGDEWTLRPRHLPKADLRLDAVDLREGFVEGGEGLRRGAIALHLRGVGADLHGVEEETIPAAVFVDIACDL